MSNGGGSEPPHTKPHGKDKQTHLVRDLARVHRAALHAVLAEGNDCVGRVDDRVWRRLKHNLVGLPGRNGRVALVVDE